MGDRFVIVLLEDGTLASRWMGWRPHAVPPDEVEGRAVQVAAWGNNSLVLLDEGKVLAFGRDADDLPDFGERRVRHVAQGWDSAAAVLEGGDLAAWGEGAEWTAHRMPGGATEVAVGAECGVARSAEGVFAWGENTAGAPPPGLEAIGVAAGHNFAVAASRRGEVLAWG
eukprot:Hpha_TRINITY_DN4735_c0_g1::TRINITY_DN4735_c0_g1_i1::g.130665::m.130665